MEFLDVVDKGLGVVSFLAFLRLVFSDLQEMKASLRRLESLMQEQTNMMKHHRAKKEVQRG
jgi:hypothetical protein